MNESTEPFPRLVVLGALIFFKFIIIDLSKQFRIRLCHVHDSLCVCECVSVTKNMHN